MYDVIVDPPSETGAVNATVAVDVPVEVAVPIVGAPGQILVFPISPVPVKPALPQYL